MEQQQDVLAKISNLKKAYNSAISKLGVPAIHEYLKPIWDGGCPVVYWTQYTPYFNDGEPCEFKVHELMPGIYADSDSPEMGEYYVCHTHVTSEGLEIQFVETSIDLYDFKANLSKLVPDQKYYWRWTNDVVEDLCKQLFGDHVGIVLFADGTYVVEEIDHD